MLSCCLKFRKNTEIKSPTIVKRNKEKVMFLSKCTVCDKTPKWEETKTDQITRSKWIIKQFRY